MDGLNRPEGTPAFARALTTEEWEANQKAFYDTLNGTSQHPTKVSDAWDALDEELGFLYEQLEMLKLKLGPIIDHNRPVAPVAPVENASGSTFQTGLWTKYAKVRTIRSEMIQLMDQLDL